MKPSTDSRREEIVTLALDGFTLDRIAARVGRSIVTVKTALRDARKQGVKVQAVRRAKPDGITAEARAEMIRLNRSGVSGWKLSKRDWATNDGKRRRIDVASVYDFLRRAEEPRVRATGKYDEHESMMLGLCE